MDAGFFRAMGAAINVVVVFDAVAGDSAAAVFALRRQCMDRAFKRVEGMLGVGDRHRERLVVVVPTDFTNGHDELLVPWTVKDETPREKQFANAVPLN
jgi:hypothetical protein